MRHHEDDDGPYGVNKKLEELSDALEAGNYNAEVTQGSALQIEEHSEIANKYLTDEAKAAMSKKATQLIAVENDRVYQCIYLGARVLKSNVERGVEKLALIANELARDGLIHSTLAPISSLDLAITTLTLPNCVVILYVLVPIESVNDIKARFPFNCLEEGGLPDPEDDVSVKLQEGEFTANIKISHNLAMIANSLSTEELLQKQIDEYLSVLPKGTVVTKKVQCAIQGLYFEHDVYFHNPLMKRIKRVEIEHGRMAEVVENQLVQFNLFTGIKYFDAEGNQLFK